jgi:hypothetical protein
MIWAAIGGLMSGFVIGFSLAGVLSAEKDIEYIEALEEKYKNLLKARIEELQELLRNED